MPRVSPAPLSAWMLAGLIDAYPHPAAISCCAELGGPDGVSVGGGDGGSAALPNIIKVGTLPLALAGVTTVIWMSTVIAGYDELSTWPTSCFAITGMPATCAFTVCFNSHFTAGTPAGTRPNTSRSKSSTISGRRCFHQTSAVVTLRPFFNVRGLGRSG